MWYSKTLKEDAFVPWLNKNKLNPGEVLIMSPSTKETVYITFAYFIKDEGSIVEA